jgi:hypothetical protein
MVILRTCSFHFLLSWLIILLFKKGDSKSKRSSTCFCSFVFSFFSLCLLLNEAFCGWWRNSAKAGLRSTTHRKKQQSQKTSNCEDCRVSNALQLPTTLCGWWQIPTTGRKAELKSTQPQEKIKSLF